MVGNFADPTSETEEPMSDESAEDPPSKPAKTRIDASKIPERAWAAADYLRHQVLESNRAAVVGTKSWDTGWAWPGGVKTRTGDGSRSGLRLSWANELRLFHVVVLKAMKNADPTTDDNAAWMELAGAMRWVFHDQPAGGPRFVIESPASLRAKWDNLQANRRNRAAQNATPKGADGRPDTGTRHERKRWGEW